MKAEALAAPSAVKQGRAKVNSVAFSFAAASSFC